MQYVQMTLNDWMELKGQLEAELRGAAAGFVRIGYLLRKIDETEGYKNDGSKSLAEWAYDNYGLSRSQVSRFISINKEFSIDGYSDQLRLEYSQFGSAKLTEMLALPDSDREMVSPEMKREDIREIKKFNREMEEEARNPEEKQDPVETIVEEAPAAGFSEPVPPDNYKWVLEFFRENGELMNELYSSAAYENSDYDAMKEIVNPSGARTFRHKTTMVSMLDSKIMIKVFGQNPGMMSWVRFFEVAEAAIGHDRIDGNATYRKTFGKDPEKESEEEPKKSTESDKKQDKNKESVSQKTKEKKEAPAAGGQKLEKNEHIPTQGEHIPEKTDKKEPEPGTNTIAPAQKETPPASVSNSKNSDSAIAEEQAPETAEEPEQVEIDEILPAPVDQDPMRDLKDRFMAELNSLKIMLDCNNFAGMTQIIERLEDLTGRMAVLSVTQE